MDTSAPPIGVDGTPRRRLSRGGCVLDVLIAGTVTGIQAAQATHQSIGWWGLPLAIAGGLSLLVRRRWPLAVALVAVAGYGGGFFIPGVAVAAYNLGAYGRNRRLAWSVCALAAGGVLAFSPHHASDIAGRIVTTGAVVVLPAVLGLYIGARRSLLESLHERAARLETEQHLLAQQTLVAERTRIAREMHDVVAHRVSLIVLHAGALEVAAGDRERTVQTAELIRGIGREALEELREVIGVLRLGDGVEETAPLTPQPTVADIPDLVAQSRAAGTDVSLRFDGSRRHLSRTVERTAYRVVQEALTNVHKHAGNAATDVVLDYSPESLEVSVTNERPLLPRSDLPSGGHGLVGLGERVRLAGGRFESGPRLDGGFAVRAVLPAAEPVEAARSGG